MPRKFASVPIYDQKDFSLITRHDISPLKGKYISKEGHASSKSRDILESERCHSSATVSGQTGRDTTART